jgi:hypothetical protein
MSVHPSLRKLALLATVAALSACSRGESPIYFPLGGDQHWEYRYHETNPLVDNEQRFDIDNAGSKPRNDQRHYLRRNENGTEYWLKIDGGDVLRVATRTAVEEEPTTDETPLKVMPVKPAVGDSWTILSQPFILERAEPFRERFTHDESKRFELHQKVVSLDEEVTVPAGTFRHCLKIEGEALIHVLADPRLGGSEVPIRQTEWYAPGVGLIKLHRIEELGTAQIVGGEVLMELVDYRD